MKDGNFDIIDWKIENFSCWHQALHERFINSPKAVFDDREIIMKMYPKGVSGLDTHIAVHIVLISQLKEFSGDLLFIGSDGSPLCSQRVQSTHAEDYLELLPPAPKFEEVVSENLSNHIDQLTLRLLIGSDKNDKFYIYTIIDAFKVNLEFNLHDKSDSTITTIAYIHGDFKRTINLEARSIGDHEKIQLYLKNWENQSFPFLVQSHLSLISNDGVLVRYEHNENVFRVNEPWTFSDSLSKRELYENIKCVILRLSIVTGKVSCTLGNVHFDSKDVKIGLDRSLSIGMEKSTNETASNDQDQVQVLSEELMCLFRDQDFSDLLVKCGGESFPVHKNILSARSPVFKKMFSSDMKESASGIVEIKDLDAATLFRFLFFLYTGSVEKDLDGDGALKLYYAADKYLVPSLKKICVKILIVNVSASNACKVLLLGDQHQEDKLVSAAHQFILRNFKEFLKSREWHDFLSSHPSLVGRTLTHFGEKGFVGISNTL